MLVDIPAPWFAYGVVKCLVYTAKGHLSGCRIGLLSTGCCSIGRQRWRKWHQNWDFPVAKQATHYLLFNGPPHYLNKYQYMSHWMIKPPVFMFTFLHNYTKWNSTKSLSAPGHHEGSIWVLEDIGGTLLCEAWLHISACLKQRLLELTSEGFIANKADRWYRTC